VLLVDCQVAASKLLATVTQCAKAGLGRKGKSFFRQSSVISYLFPLTIWLSATFRIGCHTLKNTLGFLGLDGGIGAGYVPGGELSVMISGGPHHAVCDESSRSVPFSPSYRH
jgi:hypothetical protein